MKVCQKCGEKFRTFVYVEGKERNLQRRKYCLKCSPFGKHNTRDLTKPPKKGGPKYKDFTEEFKQRLINNYNKRRKQFKEKSVQIKGGKCIQCGYSKCLGALEFHHRESEVKEFRLGVAYRHSWEAVVKEIEKCDLLCSNCHGEAEDGKPRCPKKSAVNARKRRNELKARIVEHMGGCCTLCGYKKCNRNLVLHHLDPEVKEFTFAKAIYSKSCSLEDLEEELKKCKLVCSNCHAEIHAGIVRI